MDKYLLSIGLLLLGSFPAKASCLLAPTDDTNLSTHEFKTIVRSESTLRRPAYNRSNSTRYTYPSCAFSHFQEQEILQLKTGLDIQGRIGDEGDCIEKLLSWKIKYSWRHTEDEREPIMVENLPNR